MTNSEEKALLRQIPTLLLSWFQHNARDLPWRKAPTPYQTWVSEIMLQQTRVEAVRDYYIRFTGTLPDIRALAGAEEELLLKLWEGLGYYSRARNLQKAAQMVCDRYQGQLPSSYEALLTLPGIGEYTAGAVASIAFGQPVPAVDGNVLRVLSRILNDPSDISRPEVKKAFRQKLQTIIPADFPGDFNQSLMELGATVCLPNSPPLCKDCPVASLCVGYQRGTATALPVKSAKKQREVQERTILIVLSGSCVLLRRRSEPGLLHGLWEFPNHEGRLSEVEAEELLYDLGATPAAFETLPESRHLFTHKEWQMSGFLCSVPLFPAPKGYVWADEAKFCGTYSIPSAFKTYSLLLKQKFREPSTASFL